MSRYWLQSERDADEEIAEMEARNACPSCGAPQTHYAILAGDVEYCGACGHGAPRGPAWGPI